MTNEIIDALNKNPLYIAQANESTKLDTAMKELEVLQKLYEKLQITSVEERQDSFIRGVAFGQKMVFGHLQKGPCGDGCEVDHALGSKLKPTSYQDFLVYKVMLRRKK